jgi:uncharacterized protein (DUF433 family)
MAATAQSTLPLPRAGRSPGAPAPETSSAEWIQRPLGLSPTGEFFKHIADERMAGAVQVDQQRQHGAPVLDETRIPVAYVFNELAAGKSWAEITSVYPDVTEDRIRAALRFAAAVFRRPQAVDLD